MPDHYDEEQCWCWLRSELLLQIRQEIPEPSPITPSGPKLGGKMEHQIKLKCVKSTKEDKKDKRLFVDCDCNSWNLKMGFQKGTLYLLFERLKQCGLCNLDALLNVSSCDNTPTLELCYADWKIHGASTETCEVGDPMCSVLDNPLGELWARRNSLTKGPPYLGYTATEFMASMVLAHLDNASGKNGCRGIKIPCRLTKKFGDICDSTFEGPAPPIGHPTNIGTEDFPCWSWPC